MQKFPGFPFAVCAIVLYSSPEVESLTIPIASLLVVGVLFAATVVLLLALWKRERPKFDPDWLNEFSAAKYRPMLRLLATDDYEFLASEPGFNAKIARQLRAERRRIFRAYLRNLVADFERLYVAGTTILTFASSDRSELAAQLFRARLAFYAGLIVVHTRLALHTVGIGTVDPGSLVLSVGRMRESLGALMASPQVVGSMA